MTGQTLRWALVSAASGALCCGAGAVASPFASSVAAYRPAPGQLINANGAQGPTFANPSKALGAPIGGGTLLANNSKMLTLGGFGGSVTLAFDHTVLDDPCNPLGLDAIVFGNAVWVSHDPARRWAECATIEISLDANGNGVADDPWFLIPGSALPPPAAALRAQEWDSNPSTPAPPTNLTWYPAAPNFPAWPAAYSTSAHELPPALRFPPLVNPMGVAGPESSFGYADTTPILLLGDMSGAAGDPLRDDLLTDPEDRPGIDPALFYTSPDDPWTVGITPGSGGGDAFDIAWAVDPTTGAAANLPGFDFIRITTAVDALAGPGGVLGEVSAEIGAVADVRPRFALAGDANGDGVVGFADLNLVLSHYGATGGASPADPRLPPLPGDVSCDGAVDFVDLNIVLSMFGSGALAP